MIGCVFYKYKHALENESGRRKEMGSRYYKLAIGALGISIIIDYTLMKLNYKERIKKFTADNCQHIVFITGLIGFAGLFCYGTYKILCEMMEREIRMIKEIGEMRMRIMERIIDAEHNIKRSYR
jgi:hypothetical protein